MLLAEQWLVCKLCVFRRICTVAIGLAIFLRLQSISSVSSWLRRTEQERPLDPSIGWIHLVYSD